jgi:hypothetical protein
VVVVAAAVVKVVAVAAVAIAEAVPTNAALAAAARVEVAALWQAMCRLRGLPCPIESRWCLHHHMQSMIITVGTGSLLRCVVRVPAWLAAACVLDVPSRAGYKLPGRSNGR